MVQTLQVYSQPHYWGERLNYDDDDDDDFKMTKNQLFFSQHFFPWIMFSYFNLRGLVSVCMFTKTSFLLASVLF